MRVLIISDSHGNYPHALKAHELAGPVDRIFHLGDGAEDARLLEQLLEVPVLRVAGNCDMEPGLPLEVTLDLDSCRVLLTHGHRQHVKASLKPLMARGKEVGATIVLYGHTHRSGVHSEAGLLLVNPGTLKQGYPQSYAILTITGNEPHAEIFSL